MSIAALANSYGRDCSWYEPPKWEASTICGCGGWFVQGSVVTVDGQKVSLDTDGQWVATASVDNTARVWVTPENLVNTLCSWQKSF